MYIYVYVCIRKKYIYAKLDTHMQYIYIYYVHTYLKYIGEVHYAIGP